MLLGPTRTRGGSRKEGRGASPGARTINGANTTFFIDTTRGEIKLELDADAAPAAVENFLGYVNRKFYDHTIFHRVMKRYYILAGGYDMRLKRKSTRNPIESESDNGLKNLKGAVAMYRGEDPHGATAQFMINLRNNRHFDRAYAKGDGFGYTVLRKSRRGHGRGFGHRHGEDRAEKLRQERTRCADLHQDDEGCGERGSGRGELGPADRAPAFQNDSPGNRRAPG